MAGSNSQHSNTWLRTDRPIVTFNAAMLHHLPELKAALSRGVQALPDPKRPGLYEVEVGVDWYYISVPNQGSSVYLIAARHPAPAALAV
jgi:hypothetical protein